jgi:GH35 family endo-1,4-beta-xylanase
MLEDTSLSPNQLNNAVQQRVNSIVQRYKGQVIGWDVVNENLHFSFFESKLGQKFSAKIFNEVHDIDAKATLFLNEFNTIEDSRDGLSSPSRYIKKIKEIQSVNKKVPLGIGVEAHFPSSPINFPYMRASIDTLAATGLPIWITEFDVASQPNQVKPITSMNFYFCFYNFLHYNDVVRRKLCCLLRDVNLHP